jgi:hypothetical protein
MVMRLARRSVWHMVRAMCRFNGVLLALILAGCEPVTVDRDAAEVVPTRCDPLEPFETFAPVEGVNTPAYELNPWLSPDETTILFGRGTIGTDLFLAYRTSRTDAFGESQPSGVSTPAEEFRGAFVDDGTTETLYFDRALGPGVWDNFDILQAQRPSGSRMPFGQEQSVPGVNAVDSNEEFPFVTSEALYFESTRDGRLDFYVLPHGGTLSRLDWVGPEAPLELPVLSADLLTLYFASGTDPSMPANDVWMASRDDVSQPFDAAHRLPGVSTTDSIEKPGWISGDNCRLYYTKSIGAMDWDLWVASRPPTLP